MRSIEDLSSARIRCAVPFFHFEDCMNAEEFWTFQKNLVFMIPVNFALHRHTLFENITAPSRASSDFFVQPKTDGSRSMTHERAAFNAISMPQGVFVLGGQGVDGSTFRVPTGRRFPN